MSLYKRIKQVVKGKAFKKVTINGNINYKHNYIFVHIPKNAGTSICKALGFEHSTHAEAKQYKEMLGKKYDQFFSFCFVRNPFDRFISTYNYARLQESYYHSNIHPGKSKYGKHLDYEILKNATLEEAVDLLLEGKLTHDHAWNHWRPQTEWILGTNGKLIVDYVGRVENIEADFKNICQKIQLKQEIELPVLNAAKTTKSSVGLISPNMQEKLSRFYKKDFEVLGYHAEFNKTAITL